MATDKKSQKEQNAKIVGAALAEVLPDSDKWWFQQPHLLRLNLILAIPLMSSSVSGYDGKQLVATFAIQRLVNKRQVR